METNQAPKTESAKPEAAATPVAATSAAAPATPAPKKPPLPVYQVADFVCSCNRILSKLEFVKKNGVFTGEVICKCPGAGACANGNIKITVKAIVVDAVEV